MTTRALDRLLMALEAAGFPPRSSGKGWRMPCPVCATRTLKGSLNVAPNGSLLVHWFCGHTVEEAFSALGLTLADLFERRDLRSLSREDRAAFHERARHAQWRAALAVLRQEIQVVLIAAIQLSDGEALNDEDLQRARLAALRIFDAGEVLHA